MKKVCMYQKFLLIILAQKFKCKKVVHMNDKAPIKKGLAIWFLFGSFYIPKVSNARLSCPFPLVFFFYQYMLAIAECRHDLQTWPAAIICIHDQQPWPAVMIVCEYCHCVGNCTNFLSTYTCRKIWLISCLLFLHNVEK